MVDNAQEERILLFQDPKHNISNLKINLVEHTGDEYLLCNQHIFILHQSTIMFVGVPLPLWTPHWHKDNDMLGLICYCKPNLTTNVG
jgi:hypothetical protein